MSGDPGIREAVRQLGRAVGTLVRAVVGAVGRKQQAAVGRPESGPPQQWLDLVAETDPDWLARSPWAAGGRGTQHPLGRSSGGRNRGTRIEPSEEPSLSEAVSADDEPPELRRPSSRRATWPGGTIEPEVRGPDERPRTAVGHPPVRPQPRRLVLVDPRDEVVPNAREDDPPRPVRRTEPRRVPATGPGPLSDDEAWGAATQAEDLTGTIRHATPVQDASPEGPDKAPREDEPSSPSPRVRLGALDPVPDPTPGPAALERVRTLPGRHRPAPTQSPRPERMKDLRSTRTHEPPQQDLGARPARQGGASVPVWPELPPTESLDEADAQAGSGLAAQLWLADGRPDTLTTAQRRT